MLLFVVVGRERGLSMQPSKCLVLSCYLLIYLFVYRHILTSFFVFVFLCLVWTTLRFPSYKMHKIDGTLNRLVVLYKISSL